MMASFYYYQNPVDNHSEVQIAKAPICIRKINPEGFLLWISQIGTSSPHLCLPCLFRLTALRTSYVLCVACLFRLIALRTSYFMCSVFVLTHRFKNDRAYTRVGLQEQFTDVASAESKNFRRAQAVYFCLLFLATSRKPQQVIP